MSATTFGALIRAARKAKGMTQTNLANILGVGQSSITDYEQSKNVSEATLRKVAAALGMKLRVEFVDVPDTSAAGFSSPLEAALAQSVNEGERR